MIILIIIIVAIILIILIIHYYNSTMARGPVSNYHNEQWVASFCDVLSKNNVGKSTTIILIIIIIIATLPSSSHHYELYHHPLSSALVGPTLSCSEAPHVQTYFFAVRIEILPLIVYGEREIVMMTKYVR